VKKTSVYLDDEELARLEWLARLEHCSKAEVLRAAIMAYQPACADRKFEMAGIFAGDGTSVADIPDEELMEGFGE
jgi:predicted transcriptional regulator